MKYLQEVKMHRFVNESTGKVSRITEIEQIKLVFSEMVDNINKVLCEARLHLRYDNRINEFIVGLKPVNFLVCSYYQLSIALQNKETNIIFCNDCNKLVQGRGQNAYLCEECAKPARTKARQRNKKKF